MEQAHFDREALIAEVAKRHKILLDPDDPAFALITINEIVLSRAIAIVEAKLEEMEQRLAQISAKQTETAKAIGEAIITAGAAYVAERLKDAGADLIEKVRTSTGLDQGNNSRQPALRQDNLELQRSDSRLRCRLSCSIALLPGPLTVRI